MKFPGCGITLLLLPCLLGSCGALGGVQRTIQAAGRTFQMSGVAGDRSQEPPTAGQPEPAAVALRIPATD